jgi:antitoxin component of MazEF toxin-antitoxin module
VDSLGRIALPETVMERLGVEPDGRVVLELVEDGALIKSPASETSLTQRVAEMELPVADWDQMKSEIVAGRLK